MLSARSNSLPEIRDERQFSVSEEDQRLPSQRDRDRIIHSDALRRLAGVTQVVDPAEGHVFHNRLTHTLKVAQIGRRMAEKFVNEHQDRPDVLVQIGGIDPEVVEAAALSHDLGHPPFGHVSEKVLDRLVCERGHVKDGYEGNAQSFRILTRLAIRSTEHEGLDLTRATLNAVLKYPWLRDTYPEPTRKRTLKWRKWGAYREDKECFDWVRQYDPTDHKSVEAEIMDWSDDIAFSVHDAEDFYRAGLIPLDRLVADDEYRDNCYRRIIAKWERKPRADETDKEEFREAFHGIFEVLPIQNPFEGLPDQLAILRSLTSELIDRYISKTHLNLDPQRKGSHLEIPKDYRLEVKALKELIRLFVIDSPRLATQQRGKEHVIETLFKIYFDATDDEAKTWRYIVPFRYINLVDEIHSSPMDTHPLKRARLAADIISGFTDREAIAMYRRLTGVDSGGLMALISL